MLNRVKSLRRKGKVQFEKGTPIVADGNQSKPSIAKGLSMKGSFEDPRRSRSRLSQLPTSRSSRVRFDDTSTSTLSPARSSRLTPKSSKELHMYRERRGEEMAKSERRRRSKSVVGRLSAVVRTQQSNGSESYRMVRRARSMSWFEANVTVAEKKERRSREDAILVYRKDSKSDSERVEEMFKLASECSSSDAEAVSISSVWQSLIAIENDI